MGKMNKLIALVIFLCFGISYGAEYDIKTITTIMDAYEKQIDSIKLEFTHTYPLVKQGKLLFTKGTFAQKRSEGYVLLDQREQEGKTWDNDKAITGIVRSYDGQITRYLEHEKNAHGYHMAALYEDHKLHLYKNDCNPYSFFYRLNYKTKFTDLLNNPNTMAKIEGEELVNGLKTIKINYKIGEMLCYVWLLPEKNYLPVKHQSFRIADGSKFRQMDWSEFKELAGGIWFPEKIEHYFAGYESQAVTIKVEEVDISPLTKEDFKFEFPAFTHVTDHILGISYLTTMTMEQSGIEQTPLESSLSNKEKEEILDKYLESSETTNSKDSDAIDADVKLKSKEQTVRKTEFFKRIKVAKGQTVFEKVFSKDPNVYNYLVYRPKDYEKKEKWPMILFLHGAYECGDDLEAVKTIALPRFLEKGKELPFVVICPQSPKGQWWKNEKLITFLDKVIEKYVVDENRIYLTGLSMGGFGSWSLGCACPERFAAIAPICGGGKVEKAHKLKDTPVWAFHGAKDDMVSLSRSQEMVNAVNKHGGNAKLTVYPEAKHDAWTDTYNNPQLYKWFLQHSIVGRTKSQK